MGGAPAGPYNNLDQLIRRQAETHPQDILLSYPYGDDVLKNYTSVEIERLTRVTAAHYAETLGIETAYSKNLELPRIALVGVSSIDYYITFIALQRLGLTTILISPRLADEGFAHILTTTKCSTIVVASPFRSSLEQVREAYSLNLTLIALQLVATIAEENLASANQFCKLDQEHNIVIHSGGTTGVPKPVFINPATWLAQAVDIAARMPRVDTLSTLPLFHSFGLATLLRCLVNGKRLTLLNADRPVTASVVMSVLNSTGSQALVTVPYVLKFFAEVDGGLQRLSELEQVIAAGSTIPDNLAAELLNHKVKVFHLYGLTEAGALMEPSPTDFRWITPLPHAKPFLQFDPVGDDLYHLTILPGLKTKAYSSSPDGSYATKDLFYRHPIDPNKWKFAARQDDIIVLVNGEKADPIPIEESVARNTNVRVAVAFGAERDALGLIVVASDAAETLSHADMLARILPDLHAGNARVPAYAKISSERVIIKPAGTPFPLTDKSTVKRSLFIKQFATDIEAHNREMEQSKSQPDTLSDVEVRDLVKDMVLGVLNMESDDERFRNTSDFFALGMDSLKASQLRSRLLRRLYLGNNKLATNVIFEHPNITLLTDHLLNLRKGIATISEDAEVLAHALVNRYSALDVPEEPGTGVATAPSVLLTGATGAIGVHILHQLLNDEKVTGVYCLIRASDDARALSRSYDALRKHHLLDKLSDDRHLSKITAYACDYTAGDLGLRADTIDLFRSTVTHMIHNAWSVNFNQSLCSFESGCISSTHFLLDLAATTSLAQKPCFTFVSSIATALRAPDSVPEDLVPWNYVEHMGYAQSKWVAEQIVAAASHNAHIPVRIARLGQVCGDTIEGIWNAMEAIPITVQTALSLGALPSVDRGDEELRWLPADIAAHALVELALHDECESRSLQVFNVVNDTKILWNEHFLPYLHRAGLEFDIISGAEWVRRLEAAEGNDTPMPAIKLLDFFRNKYAPRSAEKQPHFETARAKGVSSALAQSNIVDEALVGKFVKYWIEECWKPASQA